MKAMILAAGVGTRLNPLTNDKPKALVEVRGKPMLEWQINKLIKLGIKDIIINIHHFPHQIIDFVKSKHFFGINIRFSDESGLLLDTGGGLKKAAWFFNDNKPFLLHNVDVFTNLNYIDLFDFHCKNEALATLVVQSRNTSRHLLFDENKVLCGWENTSTGEKIITFQTAKLNSYAFNGIHILNPLVFDLMCEREPFSIINLYLRLSVNYKIKAYILNNTIKWFDLGKMQNIDAFEKENEEISGNSY